MTDGVPFLFATDLDGTLLPNTGKHAATGCLERTQALLNELRERGCPICFVTGRYLFLAKHGASVFRLARPDWWVCNVGTEIYHQDGTPDSVWLRRLGPELDRNALSLALQAIPKMAPQEGRKQGPHKFSWYYPEPASWALQLEILECIRAVREDLQLVGSVEESSGRALLDILPAAAGKAKAVAYLAEQHGVPPHRTFFAGDSGNDLDVVLSGVRGLLVGNTPEALKERARRLAAERKGAELYCAEAYYGDGILEGLRYYGLWAPNTGDNPQ